jgi:hypothetical protein
MRLFHYNYESRVKLVFLTKEKVFVLWKDNVTIDWTFYSRDYVPEVLDPTDVIVYRYIKRKKSK